MNGNSKRPGRTEGGVYHHIPRLPFKSQHNIVTILQFINLIL